MKIITGIEHCKNPYYIFHALSVQVLPLLSIWVNPPSLLSHYYYLQSCVSLSFLGETLRCKSCFSRKSLNDCLETAKSRPCRKNEVLCMLHQTNTTKRGSYYFEHCATKTFYKFRWESCNNPTRAIVNDARLGNVTCSIHCTGGDCSDENMSLLSFLRRQCYNHLFDRTYLLLYRRWRNIYQLLSANFICINQPLLASRRIKASPSKCCKTVSS